VWLPGAVAVARRWRWWA